MLGAVDVELAVGCVLPQGPSRRFSNARQDFVNRRQPLRTSDSSLCEGRFEVC